MTQNERVLALLRERGERGVTPMLALEVVGSMRLAARVSDLRAAGHDIRTDTAVTGTGKHVARYVLHEQAQLGLAL